MTAVATQFGVWSNRGGNAPSLAAGGGAQRCNDSNWSNADARYVLPKWMRQVERPRLWEDLLGSKYDWLTVPQHTPTVALNTTDGQNFANGNPTLEFTGTDTDGDPITYNLQIFDNATNQNFDGYVDGYDKSNANADAAFQTGGIVEVGQCFTSNGGKLSWVGFYLRQQSFAALYNGTARLYAVSGTPGSSAIPTGSALATSRSIYFGDILASKVMVYFDFSDADYDMTDGTDYFVTVEYPDGGNEQSDAIFYGYDSSSPTHSGNLASRTGSTWSADSAKDLIFVVYADVSEIGKIVETPDFSHANQLGTGLDTLAAQSFTATRSGKLTTLRVQLDQVSATGVCRAKLWAHTGTFGTDSLPGTLLATSDDLPVSAIDTTQQTFTDFTFSGSNRYPVVAGTNYVIGIEYTGATGYVYFFITTYGAPGNSSANNGSWRVYLGDFYFVAYVEAGFFSETDAGFANTVSGGDTDPFNSGEKIGFTVQAGDTLEAGTYYWRTRGRDPTGSNAWGEWSETRSFIVATAATMLVGQGSYTLTGQAVALEQGYVMGLTQGSYSLSGQSVPLVHGYKMPVTQGSYALSGQPVSLLQGYLMSAVQGAYVLTGQAVSLLQGYLIALAQGAYALTGQPVTLNKGKLISLTQGSYVLTGQALSFLFNHVIALTQGAYSLSGQNVILARGVRMPITQGSYILTGEAVSLLFGRLISLIQGGYTLTGESINMLKGKNMPVGQGSFALTGQIVNLLFNHIIALAQGSYSLIGNAVTLTYTPTGAFTLLVDTGSYALTGEALTLTRTRIMPVAQGSYLLSGQVVTLRTGKSIAITQGSYILTGEVLAMARHLLLSVGQGAYNLTGQNVSMHRDITMALVQGGYALTGQALNLLVNHILQIATGFYVLTGYGIRVAPIGGRFTIFVKFPDPLQGVVPVTFDPDNFTIEVPSVLPEAQPSYIVPIKL
jgi:hypothetical protein